MARPSPPGAGRLGERQGVHLQAPPAPGWRRGARRRPGRRPPRREASPRTPARPASTSRPRRCHARRRRHARRGAPSAAVARSAMMTKPRAHTSVGDDAGEPVDLRAQQRGVAEQPERGEQRHHRSRAACLLARPQGAPEHRHEPGAGGDAQHDLGCGGHRGGMRSDDGARRVELRDERSPRRGGRDAVAGGRQELAPDGGEGHRDDAAR